MEQLPMGYYRSLPFIGSVAVWLSLYDAETRTILTSVTGIRARLN
jgi:hypothetical protein